MNKETGSFRDPSGQVFVVDGQLFRNINSSYSGNYNHLINSGLYKSLIEKELMVSHVEVDLRLNENGEEVYKTILPEFIPFISYASEWCFGQFKDAALKTLEIQIEALKFGMILKDASSFNIQFKGYQPILIDTLSFEIYENGKPWQAYKQFCEHFLAPLLLFSKVDIGLQSMLANNLIGIPLKITSKLLPWNQKIRPSVFTHIVMHAGSQKKYEGAKIKTNSSLFNKDYLIYLAKSLKGLIESLNWKQETTWKAYYDKDVLPDYLIEKENIVENLLKNIKAKTLWDIGANDGTYSQIAAKLGIEVRSLDIDQGAVENNYQKVKEIKNNLILPLVSNLSVPSPSFGWELEERKSLFEREHPDAILALGLIHHLVIVEGIPLYKVSNLFGKITNYLIIEFIPKNDEKVVRLLQNRIDIFEDYTEEKFIEAFSVDFNLEQKIIMKSGVRSMNLFKVKKYRSN